MDKSAKKYFETFAEAEQEVAFHLLQNLNLESNSKQITNYQHVLCIPAFDESFSSISQLFDNIIKLNNEYSAQSLKNLLILVINTPLSTDSENSIAQTQIGDMHLAEERTQDLYQEILLNFKTISSEKNISLHQLSANTELLLIQRIAENGLPYKQGVGLARKIANDCAARLIAEKMISDSIIFNSDADVLFPKDYFSRPIRMHKKISAWLFPFQHQDRHANISKHPSPHFKACQLYEKSLQQYVDGLLYAHSPFAFHTIGSTLAINAKHYLEVRGFPKRNAGEDFYLLNKLRKLAPIENLTGEPLSLSARISHRIPFGTGPALESICAHTQIEDAKIFYQPICFQYLQSFIYFWTVAYYHKHSLQETQDLSKLTINFAIQSQQILSDSIFHELLVSKTKELKLIEKLHKSETEIKWQQEFLQSFDAFQTLKLLHYLRDNYFPPISYQTLKRQIST